MRPKNHKNKTFKTFVSIHAPARGATDYIDTAQLTEFVSIHAPARGATKISFNWLVGWSVSIHAPARGATVIIQGYRLLSSVSIHAPARGATRMLCERLWKPTCFNPRTRTGCDVGGMLYKYDELNVSIHAPARGATELVDYPTEQEDVSIHAPARGATLRRSRISPCRNSFNPRTRTGCDIV